MDHESGTLSNGNMALTSTNNDDGSLKVCARWLIENFCLNTYMMERNERISFGPRFEDLHSRFQFQLTLNWHIKQFKLKIRKHLPGVAYRCRINLSGVCRCVLDHPDLEYDAERGLTIDWIPESHRFSRGGLEIRCEVGISSLCLSGGQITSGETIPVDSLEYVEPVDENEIPDTQISADPGEFSEEYALCIVKRMENNNGNGNLTIYYDGGQLKTFRWIVCLYSMGCKVALHPANVKLEDVTYPSLCSAIHWVYTGEIDLEKICLREVHSAAAHLGLQPLATLCFDTIMKSIQRDNIVDVLSSFKTSDQIISNKEILTQLKEYKTYVLMTDKWSLFVLKKPRIALDILTYLLLDSKPKDVCS
ncbi:hypothetical protein M513_00797 [Trichuris suis]|nr:hypothetical protein M513_00797 [Trichuris suis]